LFCGAWANAAHLFLARAVARAHETSVRVALGASRSMLWRLFFSEAFLLSLIGGAAGLALAGWAAPALVQLNPQAATLPVPGIGFRVVLAAVALVAACGASLGLLAALQPLQPAEALQEGGRSGTGGPRQARLRSAFLVFEVA